MDEMRHLKFVLYMLSHLGGKSEGATSMDTLCKSILFFSERTTSIKKLRRACKVHLCSGGNNNANNVNPVFWAVPGGRAKKIINQYML